MDEEARSLVTCPGLCGRLAAASLLAGSWGLGSEESEGVSAGNQRSRMETAITAS